MKAMAKHRTHSIEFKRQVAQDFIAGETLHGLAKRHDISRNLIRIWVKKREAIDWAKNNGHGPHVARVRHLNDKKKADHWRAV
jgi:transposase-like protein